MDVTFRMNSIVEIKLQHAVAFHNQGNPAQAARSARGGALRSGPVDRHHRGLPPATSKVAALR